MTSIGFLVYDITLMGGAERVAISLANAMIGQYDVHLISVFFEKDKPCFPVDSRVNIHRLKDGCGSIPPHLISLCSDLRRYIRQKSIDVLFSITAGVNSVMVGAAIGTKVKTVFCEHSNLDNHFYGRKHRFRQWLGSRFCTQVVTLTERDAANFREQFRLPAHKVRCIYNWIGDEWLEKAPDCRLDSHRIVTAGRLTKVKGYDRLTAVAQKVLERYPDWEWHIYGDGEDREQIEADIKTRGLTGRVKLMGAHSHMREIYPQYSLYVLTSYNEGLPLALLEAQSCGLPLVAYNCPTGPEEIILDRRNGLLVPPGDQTALAAAIEQLMENEELRRQFSDHSRDAIDRFSRCKILKQWQELIEDCLRQQVR